MEQDTWSQFHPYILQLEQEGLITRTFRRLDPHRQQEILAAVLAEATEKGPTAVNIKLVAERANASIGSLYTYFTNREGMLDFAIELCVRFMTDSFDAFRPYLADLSLRDALSAYLSGGLEWSQTQLGLVSFFARAAYHGDPELTGRLVQPIASAMRELVLEILHRASARGEVRADIDLEASARIVNAAMIAVADSQLLPYLNAYFQVFGKGLPAERLLEALLDLILKGIGSE